MATKTPYQAVLDDAMPANNFPPLTVTLNSSMVEASQDADGNIVLTFHYAKLDYCPDVLAADVHSWCARNKINSEILVDAMLLAATQEAALSNLRDAMLFKS